MSIATYLLVLLSVAVLPLYVGRRLARRQSRLKTFAHVPPRPAFLLGVLAVVLWFSSACFARWYAETDSPGWAAAEWFAHSGKWFVFSLVSFCCVGLAAGSRNPTLASRRSVFVIPAVALATAVVVWRTVPIYIYLSPYSTRDDMRLIRQSVEVTCGPVALANFLERCSLMTDASERDIARLSGTTCEGTTRRGLIRAAIASGADVADCRKMTFTDLISCGAPCIVSISTLPSVRHATLFLRSEGDRMYFFDPAYGYTIMRMDRFQTIWYGKTIILQPKAPLRTT